MSKSKENFITLEEIFSGNNNLLEQSFSPMTVRFYMLQAHHSSPLDFSNEALKAAEQGFTRLMKGMQTLKKLRPSTDSTCDVKALQEKAYESINDDLNCPVLLAHLFEGVRLVNAIKDGHERISASDLESLQHFLHIFVCDILGLKTETDRHSGDDELSDQLIRMILQLRQEAKERKDFDAADRIRSELAALSIKVKDTRDGSEWERE